MATISTYSNLNGAVLALDAVFSKLYHIEAAKNLLRGVECGEIKDDAEPGSINFSTLAIEALSDAMSDIYEPCDEIRGYLESVGGEPFIYLVDNAQDTPEGRAQS